MNPQLTFLFYLAAVVCFGLAAFAPAPGIGRAGRGGRIGLVPLGLGLWLFPLMWTAGAEAF